MNKAILLSAAALLIGGGGVQAAETIPVGPFHSVGIDGSAHVIFKYGTAQRVVLLKGDSKVTKIYIDSPGNLEIKSCDKGWFFSCIQTEEVEVEITTPDIHGIAISGSGKIEAADKFPVQDKLDIAISGSGAIDLRNIPTHSSNTAIDGSGDVKVNVDGNLKAAISGSGRIRYWGNPHISEDISGSGSIEQGT